MNIFKNPIIFFPSNKQNVSQNLGSIIKLSIYIMIAIATLTKNYKLCVFLIVIAFIMYFINSKIIPTKKMETYNKNICRKTTIDNPMGNPLLYTPQSELDLKLCKYQDKKIEDNLNHNIYYDSGDLFRKKQNTRSFYTQPSQTHPNDIDEYKKYLYYFDNPTCKVDGKDCVNYVDVRYHKTNFDLK